VIKVGAISRASASPMQFVSEYDRGKRWLCRVEVAGDSRGERVPGAVRDGYGVPGGDVEDAIVEPGEDFGGGIGDGNALLVSRGGHRRSRPK
jgi:hypothetical protein